MSQNQPSVSDIFRRAQAMRRENPRASYKDLRAQLVKEYKGKDFPPVYNLTIPEQDARAPEEDWTSGLALVLRGIQQKNWDEIANGIVLSLEQTENYEQQRGASQSDDDWHDRTAGIRDPLRKGVDKWMPAELRALVDQQSKKSGAR